MSSGSSEIDFYPNTHAITVDFCLEASSKEGHTLFLTSFYFGYINVLQHTPLKLVLCLIELILLLSIEVQYIFKVRVYVKMGLKTVVAYFFEL